MDSYRIYIDYSSFLVGCSYKHMLNVDKYLGEVIATAKEQHPIERVIAVADWQQMGHEAQLTQMGIECRNVQGINALSIWHQLQHYIASDLQDAPHIEDIIIIAGPTYYRPVIEQVHNSNRQIHIWSSSRVKPNTRALADSWRPCNPPDPMASPLWRRRTMSQAIVLIADDLHQEYDILPKDQFVEALAKLDPFGDDAETWVNIAVWENLLYLQAFEDETGYILNRQHRYVDETLQTSQRIVSLMQAMLGEEGWVAFGALERSLASSKLLLGQRRFRQEWLELMVALHVFDSEKRDNPRSKYKTTVLMPNNNHPAIRNFELEQHLRIVQLIVIVDNFLTRHHSYTWMAISTLLKRLTGLMTRIEARETLANVQEQKIVQLGSVTSRKNPSYQVSTLALNRKHPIVLEALTRRDEIINLLHAMLINRYRGIERAVIEQKLHEVYDIHFNEISVWLTLLIEDGLLIENVLSNTDGYHTTSLMLNTDPVVTLVVD